MEATLNKIKDIWDVVIYDEDPHKGTDISLLKMNEENFDTLEEH
jgi:hypothetical protein